MGGRFEHAIENYSAFSLHDGKNETQHINSITLIAEQLE